MADLLASLMASIAVLSIVPKLATSFAALFVHNLYLKRKRENDKIVLEMEDGEKIEIKIDDPEFTEKVNKIVE